MRLLGKLLGIDNLESIDQVGIEFVAPWASAYPLTLVLILVGVGGVTAFFYRNYQPSSPSRLVSIVLTVFRTLVLALLVLLLAEPVVALATSERYRPLLVMLFDATESMQIVDPQAQDETQTHGAAQGEDAGLSRADLLRSVIGSDKGGFIQQLDKHFRVRAYVMERPDQVREVDPRNGTEGRLDAGRLAEMIPDGGAVSAYGSAFDDLYRRHQAHRLAGVVVFGDFVQNAGPLALPAALRMGRPFYTVGFGPREVADLAVDLRVPALLKKEESVDLPVRLRQSGLDGRAARVQLYARAYESADSAGDARPEPVGEPRTVDLTEESQTVVMPYRPGQPGRYALEARVEAFDDEALPENNSVTREVVVRDESLRMLFIEYQPTWEWRFLKEVFERDPLVGKEGFRTFLRSASLKVRRGNPLFLESLIRSRSELFSYDIIVISDLPAEMLSDDLQDMLREYVSQFGGGLVFIAGPQFGPQALARTKLAEMMPVVPDPQLSRVDRPFHLKLTPAAAEYDFMRLGRNQEENQLAWGNLGRLPWYQPVARPHPLATVLASHPTDHAGDGSVLQPLIASRRFGRGEVIYFGFNETWRMRRLYGEKYHRQLWGQLTYRLGLSRAMGQGKRFVVHTDRPNYRSGDKVIVSVEAYDRDFGAMEIDQLQGRLVVTPIDSDGEQVVSEVVLPLARDGVVFEAVLPVFAAGRYRLLVTDPITEREVEATFSVTNLSIERRSATRGTALQTALASQTGGVALELHEAARLPELLSAEPVRATTKRYVPLGHTWLVLCLVLTLMFGEWLIRKLSNMR